jgi:hypothetical protein
LEENAMVLICKRVLHDWRRMPWYLYVKEYSMIGGECHGVNSFSATNEYC